jgi:bifunctional DNA-binding transcriptional regulator/antitoxin component of YhaV-PrlF toxin-antitoxin module
VLGVDSTGRVTLPAEARKAIGVPCETSVAAIRRGMTVILRSGGVRLFVPVDGRWPIELPPWPQRRNPAARSGRSQSSRVADGPRSPTTIADELIDVAGEER